MTSYDIKRERLEKTIAGQPTDRSPVTAWRHFPGDDQRTADFAKSLVQFQHTYDWDIAVTLPSRTDVLEDHGGISQWRGNLYGLREITRPAISRSLDWTELRSLDPNRASTGRHIETLRLVNQAIGAETPILYTIYSPLSQASILSGENLLQRNLRRHAERLKSGLNILTENTLRTLEALKKIPISGILYIMHYADYDHLGLQEYMTFGEPYDAKILTAAQNNWWLNIASAEGEAPMFDIIKTYPAQIIHWNTEKPDIVQGKSLLSGAAGGGIHAWDALHQLSPSALRDKSRQAIQAANGRRLLLSPDGAIPLTTPWSNLRTLRDAVTPIRS